MSKNADSTIALTDESIYDATGLLRSDLEQVTVSPERRLALDALITVMREADAAEAALKLADQTVAEAVKLHGEAVAALPRDSFMDEWRRMTARRPGAGSVEDQPTGPAPQIVLQQAEEALALARDHQRAMHNAVADTREEVARALAAYNATAPIMTPEENIRRWIATQNAEREARARGLLPRASAVDRAAIGDPDARARVGARGGGGDSFRRGAFTKAEAARENARRAQERALKA